MTRQSSQCCTAGSHYYLQILMLFNQHNTQNMFVCFCVLVCFFCVCFFVFVFFFFFFGLTLSVWKFLGRRLDSSCCCNLHHSCNNAATSSCNCARLGMQPSLASDLRLCRDTPDTQPTAPQQELPQNIVDLQC